MRKMILPVFVLAALAAPFGVGQSSASATANANSCWGQATMVFAMTGEMGMHASAQEEPRLGLRNLARALADVGAIPDDSMASLGVFVSESLGLSVDACVR